MADFYERCGRAWLETRKILRNKVKILFLVPRKGRKSTIVTQSGPPWLLVQDPDLAIVIDSEHKERSNDFLGSIKNILDGTARGALFSDILGSWKNPDLQWREDKCVVAVRKMLQRKEQSLITSSVEIGYTGGAADCIGIDDPMSPESHTEVWMQKVIKHFDGMGPVGMPDSFWWVCMTRYDDADLAGHIERTEGWHVCDGVTAEKCIRAGKCSEATDVHPQPWHVFFREALDDKDQSIDEVVWPTSFLHQERRKYPAFFSAQYLNNPWSNPDASFQKEDFSYAEKAPADVVKVLTTDVAWKTVSDETDRSGDFSVFLLGEHQKSTGSVYVTDIRRGRWTMGEWGDEFVRVIRAARSNRVPVSRVTYEELRGGAAGALETSVRAACQRWSELAPALIKAPRSTQRNAKIERVKAIASYFQNHQVFFVRPCRNTEYDHDCDKCRTFQVLRDELLKLGATMYDDAADAMADQFLPDVYTAAPVEFSRNTDPPAPVRPYDDELKGEPQWNDPDNPASERLLRMEMDDLSRPDPLRFYPRPN